MTVAERPGSRRGAFGIRPVFFGHNVAPYFSSLLGELLGPSAPGYQGERSIGFFPVSGARAW